MSRALRLTTTPRNPSPFLIRCCLLTWTVFSGCFLAVKRQMTTRRKRRYKEEEWKNSDASRRLLMTSILRRPACVQLRARREIRDTQPIFFFLSLSSFPGHDGKGKKKSSNGWRDQIRPILSNESSTALKSQRNSMWRPWKCRYLFVEIHRTVGISKENWYWQDGNVVRRHWNGLVAIVQVYIGENWLVKEKGNCRAETLLPVGLCVEKRYTLSLSSYRFVVVCVRSVGG